jgi:hypothetical protein
VLTLFLDANPQFFRKGNSMATAAPFRATSSEADDHSEGVVARTIEEQTAKLPSDTFLWAAVGSMGLSLFLRLNDRKDASLFVGQWAAPLLLFGVYNKLVKVAGSDRTDTKR